MKAIKRAREPATGEGKLRKQDREAATGERKRGDRIGNQQQVNEAEETGHGFSSR
jgi:hypothetical protein